MIELDKLTRRYGSLLAVDSLSFEVKPGEVTGFLGPNGAGKTTTMRMLAGFLAPSSGSARIAGFDVIEQSRQARQQLGYLPEGAPSYAEMSVTAFLEFIAGSRGLDGAEAKTAIESALESVDLGPVRQRLIHSLSKGFRRRVGLAQAILHNPPVLILDEPTDGLDPNQKQQVRRLIRRLASDRTILISTHILEEVEAVCQRAIIIAGGRILADDTPTGLIRHSRFHNAVTVRVNEPDAAASRLSQLGQVRKVSRSGDELTAFPAGDDNILQPVLEALSTGGWPVLAVKLEQGRLDEVFRDLTREDAA